MLIISWSNMVSIWTMQYLKEIGKNSWVPLSEFSNFYIVGCVDVHGCVCAWVIVAVHQDNRSDEFMSQWWLFSFVIHYFHEHCPWIATHGVLNLHYKTHHDIAFKSVHWCLNIFSLVLLSQCISHITAHLFTSQETVYH